MSEGVRKTAQRFARLSAVFGVVLVLFVVALAAAYALPRGPIVKHVGQSIDQLQYEGMSYKPFFGMPSYRFDTLGECVMLNVALGRPGGSPLANSLEDLMAGPPASVVTSDAPLVGLQSAVAGKYTSAASYGRYWHGYQVFLRPALVVFSYISVRYLNMFGFALLGLVVLFALRRRLGASYAFAFLISLLWVAGLILPMMLEFTPVFWVACIGALAMLVLGDREDLRELDLEAYLILGMLTSFVDQLTVPLITLGIPLVVLLAMRDRADAAYTWRSGAATVVRASAAWVAGYGLSWASKWLVASVVLGRNMVADALGAAAHRTSGAVTDTVAQQLASHHLNGVAANIAMMVPLFGLKNTMSGLQVEGVAAFVGLALLALTGLAAVAIRFHRPWHEVARLWPILLVAAMPYLWYTGMQNHSTQHFWFTYRAQFITLFGILVFLLSMTDRMRVAEKVASLRWVRVLMPTEQAAVHESSSAHGGR